MAYNFVAFSDRLLGPAKRERAEEVRLLSGVHPLLVSRGVTHQTLGFELRGPTLHAIHSECLARSERMDLEFRADAEYHFTSPELGAFRCKYSSSTGVVSLSIYPDETSSEVEAANRPKRPPGLRAEADPPKSND